MDHFDLRGFDFNVMAVFIAQILAQELNNADMSSLASFLYTLAGCMSNIVDAREN